MKSIQDFFASIWIDHEHRMHFASYLSHMKWLMKFTKKTEKLLMTRYNKSKTHS